ncbi:helix-turn-helix domain-containing protein [Morganella morganii]|uniref:helix-turn-helix domain-containing protein n=1 Tax=Morganella morganii TaxID=582 RepID=UPI0021D1C01C|nr:helix-turn-helix transcriptional regulator [Morganella morganii]MCU6224193.1 helix-turn-helix domain-containing protein [Morganella morganii]MCU6234637.1 helix-turn-helix domain-containing protein [Morganella morganii]MCU6239417.1 helix-turn-helix domain-containing protein [Morganella morganii]MCU6375816.1 helix-turn-helix domain-containing protein [Morganella morganii]
MNLEHILDKSRKLTAQIGGIYELSISGFSQHDLTEMVGLALNLCSSLHNDIKDSSFSGKAVEGTSHKKCVQMGSWGDFPQRLKRAMKVAGLTQKELAERAGVSQSVISRLITGKDKTGTRSGVLSHALGVNFDWLHYGTGEMYPANFSANNREV